MAINLSFAKIHIFYKSKGANRKLGSIIGKFISSVFVHYYKNLLNLSKYKNHIKMCFCSLYLDKVADSTFISLRRHPIPTLALSIILFIIFGFIQIHIFPISILFSVNYRKGLSLVGARHRVLFVSAPHVCLTVSTFLFSR
jgi:hypothetical protein